MKKSGESQPLGRIRLNKVGGNFILNLQKVGCALCRPVIIDGCNYRSCAIKRWIVTSFYNICGVASGLSSLPVHNMFRITQLTPYNPINMKP